MPSLWIVPENAGGVRGYAETLLRGFGDGTEVLWKLPEPAELAGTRADLIHVQHEFGLFGSKLPGRYRFPKWFGEARRRTSGKKWIATAHTVLDENWQYRTAGRGWRSIPLSVLNLFLPLMRGAWMEKTWGGFDGVIVHSEHQRKAIQASGCSRVAVIPHYVPDRPRVVSEPEEPTVLLFGYFSPEKGQDVAIQAWAALGERAPKLILAGGARRAEDRGYHAMCLSAIARLGLGEKIQVTGYVPEADLGKYFSSSTLVLAPFRETSGSGSLAMALGHGAAILASDLPLNREIEKRTPGSLAFFRSESSDHLAEEIENLLGDSNRRAALREGAVRYAEAYSVGKTVDLHRAFYREILDGGKAK